MPLDLLTPLRDYGLSPVEHGGWRNRGRPGAFDPLGVMLHHTAGSQRAGPTASLNSVTNGRAGLAGPLCNGYVDRTGRPWLIAANRSNHGGAGYSGTLRVVRTGVPVAYWKAPQADDGVDGNRWWLGIEVENDGVGEHYPEVVIETAVRMAAAWSDAFGWHPSAVMHHRQHSRRKVDMSVALDGPFWTAVTIWVHHVPTPPGEVPLPSTPEPWRYDNVNIAQYPVRVTLDRDGNGYGDAQVSISKVVGEPRMNGSLAVYDIAPGVRRETYGVDGVTRIEVQGGPPGGAIDFVVSAVD